MIIVFPFIVQGFINVKPEVLKAFSRVLNGLSENENSIDEFLNHGSGKSIDKFVEVTQMFLADDCLKGELKIQYFEFVERNRASAVSGVQFFFPKAQNCIYLNYVFLTGNNMNRTTIGTFFLIERSFDQYSFKFNFIETTRDLLLESMCHKDQALKNSGLATALPGLVLKSVS